jgi:ABC-type multidrug transport system permease subunit
MLTKREWMFEQRQLWEMEVKFYVFNYFNCFVIYLSIYLIDK